MRRVKLVFGENPSTGLPQLQDPDGILEAEQLLLLQQEVTRRYSLLVATGEGKIVEFPLELPPDIPVKYRVSVRRASNQRSHTLCFESVSDETQQSPNSPLSEVPSLSPPPDWRLAFFSALEKLIDRKVATAERQTARTPLAELRDLANRRPNDALLLLYIGYLRVAETLQETDRQRRGAYAAALAAMTAEFHDVDKLTEEIDQPMGSQNGMRSQHK